MKRRQRRSGSACADPPVVGLGIRILIREAIGQSMGETANNLIRTDGWLRYGAGSGYGHFTKCEEPAGMVLVALRARRKIAAASQAPADHCVNIIA